MTDDLTPRQDAFCRAFAAGGSAAAAARAAGYGAAGARTQAWRLLRQRPVRRRLMELHETARAGKSVFAGRIFAQAEALRAKAQAEGDPRLALRAMDMQLRIARDYGVPLGALLEATPEEAAAAEDSPEALEEAEAAADPLTLSLSPTRVGERGRQSPLHDQPAAAGAGDEDGCVDRPFSPARGGEGQDEGAFAGERQQASTSVNMPVTDGEAEPGGLLTLSLSSTGVEERGRQSPLHDQPAAAGAGNDGRCVFRPFSPVRGRRTG
jgi:hypothetical protein